MMPPVRIRPAVAADLPRLTEVSLRAKASWGYDEAFMAACREELTMTPEKFGRRRVWVAQAGEALVGLIACTPRDDGRWAEIEEFFVEPSSQGRGLGRALLETLIEACRSRGVRRLELNSDPFAEAIYVRLGFVTVGSAPSESIPGRSLPRMALELGAGRPAG